MIFLFCPALLSAQDMSSAASADQAEESYIPQLPSGAGNEWAMQRTDRLQDSGQLTDNLFVFNAAPAYTYEPVQQIASGSYTINYPETDIPPGNGEPATPGILEAIKEQFEAASEEEKVNVFRDLFEAVMKEEQKMEPKEDDRMLPVITDLDGMVLDETRSKTGREFYGSFFSSWTKPEGVQNYTIRISEKPGPGLVSAVFVEVNHENIFQMRLQPGDQRVRKAAEYAVSRTLEHLQENTSNYIIY